jgi:uncharacterized protein (TIGR03000 family)
VRRTRSAGACGLMAIGLLAAWPAAAPAQYRTGFGVGGYYGRGVGYPGFGFPAVGFGTVVGARPGYVVGFGFGYYPGAYSSSWSNGFSLYGPPVPTYGPIAGAFGGSDQRLNYGNPWYPRTDLYYPTAPFPGRPGVMYAVPTESFQADQRLARQSPEAGVEPAPQPRRQPDPTGAKPVARQAPIEIDVVLPVDNAEVLFDGHATKQVGRTRMFTTPPVADGPVYRYEIEARWTEKGQAKSAKRQVEVLAGERVKVDFTQPD